MNLSLTSKCGLTPRTATSLPTELTDCHTNGKQQLKWMPPCKSILACDPDWTYSNITNACYKMIYNLNWTDAENACVSEGAHLASIHNPLEDHFLDEFTKTGISFSSGYVWVWVGLNDLAGVGSWTWTDGTPFDYFNWAPSEPNGLDSARCVEILPDQWTQDDGYFQRWANTYCTLQMRAGVCQKPARLN
uniref:C-type lectin domain-containing protein n=1 Tax=Acrobeloides nanus TaxID=290746 RepID=A0A914EBK0_9BILA